MSNALHLSSSPRLAEGLATLPTLAKAIGADSA
jgi:hypothetical protein